MTILESTLKRVKDLYMITFICSKCERSYRVSEEYADKRVKCKGCSHVILIPKPENQTLGSGDSIAAYNDLLKELSKAENTVPTVEIAP